MAAMHSILKWRSYLLFVATDLHVVRPICKKQVAQNPTHVNLETRMVLGTTSLVSATQGWFLSHPKLLLIAEVISYPMVNEPSRLGSSYMFVQLYKLHYTYVRKKSTKPSLNKR